ncbi:hypothetical protein ACTNEO_20185 [Gracilibacillus sp. HCP3S3_G5_1]|uniref:hypothetical protein n=1 Tax=unclassified Gracilibacillus TaxID=2625209 RepID=UPI003F8B3383
MTNLQNQVYLYSVSTDAFYNKEEMEVHNKLMKLHTWKNKLKEYSVDVSKRKGFISNKINQLNNELDNLLDDNEGIRVLREDELKDSNKISQFFSTLTRTLKLKEKDTTTDIIMVRAYHYRVLEGLIAHGFMNEDGEHYQYFASSAGMIRNKKSVFIKSSVVKNEYFNNRIWCGLDENKINNTSFTDNNGDIEYGINMNKFNAYLALSMTSSEPFENFDIDKTIVVDDFETEIYKDVDYIDKDTFEVTRKVNHPITIPHTDGAGIIIPSVSEKAIQFRMPHFKGLLIPTPFDEFIKEEMKKEDVTVTDIYGDEWDIIDDDIQIIFTKSQFKMAKYYKNWNEYKQAFKDGQCEFVICKEEDNKFIDKPINYQVLQTLIDTTADELRNLADNTNKDIANAGQDKDIMLRILGFNKDDDKMNNFQKSLSIYPELLNDKYSKESIRNTRDAMYKDAKAGKLWLKDSKRTFISPDTYAFCEWLFMGIDDPKGLLNDGDVSCQLYKDGKELDVLRSPHLYKEHAIRKNVVNNKTNKWFVTNCIYTSVSDAISKILMCDVDGDEAHIISDETYVELAKRNTTDVVPLEYELATGKKETITSDNIYNSLVAAYSKNIGEISNKISKIWNLPKDKIEEKVVKQLCFINNAIIDFAKTLWMPTVPEEVEEKINQLTDGKLPHFFKYAKDKKEDQINPLMDVDSFKGLDVEEQNQYIDNLSTVNKLEYIIEKKRVYFSKVVDDFDFRMLMKKKKVVKVNQTIIDEYNRFNRKKKWSINKELKISSDVTNLTQLQVYDAIRKALLKIEPDINKVVDTLVQYLYIDKPDSKKSTLWESFGDILLNNLRHNIDNETEICEDCNNRFRKVNKNKVCCDKCDKKRKNKEAKERMRNKRRKEKLNKKIS